MNGVARRVRCVRRLGRWLSAAAPAWAQEARSFIVAGGPVGGSYYRLAGQVCEAVTRAPVPKALRCLVLPSDGSGENLALLAATNE